MYILIIKNKYEMNIIELMEMDSTKYEGVERFNMELLKNKSQWRLNYHYMN